MPAQPPSPDQPSSAPARRRSRQASSAASGELKPATVDSGGTADQEPQKMRGDDADIAGELSFMEAQTALELSLAELQAPDLDVEEMAGLYRRACRYAERCEQLLQRVEQEVLQWDPEQPQTAPQPYQP